MVHSKKLSIGEKIAYALGDGSANIAWRGVSTFLLIFYTDVFGLAPAVVGTLMLVARLSDGISDVVMGVVGDKTKSKYGHFRPWILWTAAPLGIILSLLFTAPDWSTEWKIVYAYVTYILFTLIYTANNIPYGALMAVMTPDDKERASLGSYRMVGAFAGGMVVQGALLFLVAYFGNIDPAISVSEQSEGCYEVCVTAQKDVDNVNITTSDGVALIAKADSVAPDGAILVGPSEQWTAAKSFEVKKDEAYHFVIKGQDDLTADDLRIIDQSQGYSKSIYVMSFFLVLALLVTFRFTKERVQPMAQQKSDVWSDLKDLVHNRPWLVLLAVGLLFNIYNNIKQGITVIYFTHYVHDQFLAATYMVCLMVASIGGAMLTAPLVMRYGKKAIFIVALLATGLINALLAFCGPQDVSLIFIVGIASEVFAAFLPTLFFAMLGDTADYSEYVNNRRATGLVYSAGSFATKFGGGIAGAIIGAILGVYGYDGKDAVAIAQAADGIVMLMSWVPAVIVVVSAGLMLLYPLDQSKQSKITAELEARRRSDLVAQS